MSRNQKPPLKPTKPERAWELTQRVRRDLERVLNHWMRGAGDQNAEAQEPSTDPQTSHSDKKKLGRVA